MAMSTPAERPRPVPLRTMVETSLCPSIAERADMNSSIIAKSITFTGGWDSATRAAAPSKVSSMRLSSVVAIGIQFTARQGETENLTADYDDRESGSAKALPADLSG